MQLPNSFGMSTASSFNVLPSSASFDTFSQMTPKSFGSEPLPRPASMPALMGGGPVQFEPGTGMPQAPQRRKVKAVAMCQSLPTMRSDCCGALGAPDLIASELRRVAAAARLPWIRDWTPVSTPSAPSESWPTGSVPHGRRTSNAGTWTFLKGPTTNCFSKRKN